MAISLTSSALLPLGISGVWSDLWCCVYLKAEGYSWNRRHKPLEQCCSSSAQACGLCVWCTCCYSIVQYTLPTRASWSTPRTRLCRRLTKVRNWDIICNSAFFFESTTAVLLNVASSRAAHGGTAEVHVNCRCKTDRAVQESSQSHCSAQVSLCAAPALGGLV